jgi:hypothetical protein
MADNDWIEYKRLILNKMEEDEKRWIKMFEMVGELRTDVSGLKVKSKFTAAIIGGTAGVIGTAVATAAVSLWK